MGGAYKPSRETEWRMDHPPPSPARPTWRERRKARKKLKAKPGVSGSTRTAGKGQG